NGTVLRPGAGGEMSHAGPIIDVRRTEGADCRAHAPGDLDRWADAWYGNASRAARASSRRHVVRWYRRAALRGSRVFRFGQPHFQRDVVSPRGEQAARG